MTSWPKPAVRRWGQAGSRARKWWGLLGGALLGSLAAASPVIGQTFPAGEVPAGAVGQPPAGTPTPGQVGDPSMLPPPRPANAGRLPSLPYSGLGSAPAPNPDVIRRYGNYVQELRDPQLTMDLVAGQTRLMVLKQAPVRIQVADETVASYTILTPTQISLMGRLTGTTVLTLWFTDPATRQEEVLTYHVRVVPDPTDKDRLEKQYKALAVEINRAFPSSVIDLKLVGDKLLVTGHAKDVAEASKILQVVRAHAPIPGRPAYPVAGTIPVDPSKSPTPTGPAAPPAIEDYVLGGNGFVVNMLQINGEQQVSLNVTVAEVNRAAARSIGMNFSISNNRGLTIFANNTGAIANGGQAFGGVGQALGLGINNRINQNVGVVPQPGVVVGAGGFNNLPAAIDNGQIRLAISALKVLQYARTKTEPNLVTMNGQTATMRAGSDMPIPTVSFNNAGFGAIQGVGYQFVGVELNFTPFITDRDRIRMNIDITVSAKDLANVANINGAAVAGMTKRWVRTTVEMREGETFAIGGLVQNTIDAIAHRVPGIGELPILSRLLGFDRATSGEQELVVVVTPHLVHPLAEKEQMPLPGSDLFEPGDIEFYVLGRLESRQPLDYRTQVRTDWRRLTRLPRQAEAAYMSGPVGHDVAVPPPPPPVAPPGIAPPPGIAIPPAGAPGQPH